MKFTIFSTNSTPIFITEGVTGDLSGGPGVPKTTYGLFKNKGISSEVLQLRCPELEQALKVIEFYGDKENWIYASGPGPDDIITFDFVEKIGGQKAREFLEGLKK